MTCHSYLIEVDWSSQVKSSQVKSVYFLKPSWGNETKEKRKEKQKSTKPRTEKKSWNIARSVRDELSMFSDCACACQSPNPLGATLPALSRGGLPALGGTLPVLGQRGLPALGGTMPPMKVKGEDGMVREPAPRLQRAKKIGGWVGE